MKLLELYFVKKLSSIGTDVWQEVAYDTVSVIDPSTLNDEKRISVVKTFVSEMVLDSLTDETSSDAILKALNNIKENDKSIFDINKSLGVLANNDVEILIVERDDLPVESPLEETSKIKTLIVNKTIYDSKLLCFGQGRGHLYSNDNYKASAFDFIDFFEMEADEMKDNGIYQDFTKWEVLKNKENGGRFIDDSKMIDFLKSRGYNYYYLYL